MIEEMAGAGPGNDDVAHREVWPLRLRLQDDGGSRGTRASFFS
jgi:hypothetical protein